MLWPSRSVTTVRCGWSSTSPSARIILEKDFSCPLLDDWLIVGGRDCTISTIVINCSAVGKIVSGNLRICRLVGAKIMNDGGDQKEALIGRIFLKQGRRWRHKYALESIGRGIGPKG